MEAKQVQRLNPLVAVVVAAVMQQSAATAVLESAVPVVVAAMAPVIQEVQVEPLMVQPTSTTPWWVVPAGLAGTSAVQTTVQVAAEAAVEVQS